MRPVRGGSRTEPLCGTCARPDASFWHACPLCGEQTRIRGKRPCLRCVLRQRLRDILSGENGAIRPELHALFDNLANYERPLTVLGWLDLSRATDILRELGNGVRPVSHATLDDLPEGNPVEHLRSMLVSLGTLPPRDEQMIRLERWAPASSMNGPILTNNTSCAATASGTCCGGSAAASRAPRPPTTNSSRRANTFAARSPCSTGWTHTTSHSPPGGDQTSITGSPTTTTPPTAARPGTSCDGPTNRN
jgi:hypothetical protein